MRLGATLVHLADAPPYPVGPWAQRLVAAGFESLWTPEIIGRGPLVPDPFVVLATAAAVTAEVELGTATLQVPLHHPVELAHRVLSLMTVSGGRLTLGLSPGSTRDDYDALERDHATRFAVFRRDVERLRGLVARGRDEGAVVDLHHGNRPGGNGFRGGGTPEVLLGSWGVNVERAAREFDGWLASGYRTGVEDILRAHDRFRAAGGRRAIVCAIPLNERADLDTVADALARYAQAGVDDAVLLLGPHAPTPEEARALFP